ncbi:MAG: hypothetical protein R2853_14160 [Thermomicrobiales bacterium]
MRPRFSFSRGEDLEAPAAPGDSELAEAGDQTLDPGVPDSAPIRPDLGPPAPGPQSGNQPGSGLGLIISVAVAAVVFVLAIYATGSPTANPLPLAQTTNALFWLVGVVATAAAGFGAVYADRTAFRGTQFEDQQAAPDFNTAWITPVIATATAILLVATYHNTMMIVAGPLIAFVGNAGSLLSRDLLDDADDTALKTATTIHTLVVHTIAFLALSAIYLNKLPTVIVALLACVATALLVLESLERRQVLASRKVLLAVLAGSAVAAVATPLMWWLTHGWTGGAVLFVAFYVAAGVISTVATNGTLRMRDALEYGVVSLAAFIILAVTA